MRLCHRRLQPGQAAAPEPRRQPGRGFVVDDLVPRDPLEPGVEMHGRGQALTDAAAGTGFSLS